MTNPRRFAPVSALARHRLCWHNGVVIYLAQRPGFAGRPTVVKTSKAMTTAAENEPVDAAAPLKIVADATCTFCGCVCDDIDLTVQGDRIVEAKRAPPLGESWFFSHRVEQRPSCLIAGRPATVEEGIELPLPRFSREHATRSSTG